MWTADDDAFRPLRVDDVDAAGHLHAALDFDDVAKIIHKQRHRAVRQHRAGVVEGNKGAAMLEQMLHHQEKRHEATAKRRDVRSDDDIANRDRRQKSHNALTLNLASKVILDPAIFCYFVVFAPQRKLLTFLLERGGVALMLEEEVVHGDLGLCD